MDRNGNRMCVMVFATKAKDIVIWKWRNLIICYSTGSYFVVLVSSFKEMDGVWIQLESL